MHAAKQRRIRDPNVTFQDVAKPKSLPVQTLVKKHQVTIQWVSDDGTVIHYAPTLLDPKEPTFSPVGMLSIADHKPGVLTLPEACSLEPGDLLTQDEYVGDLAQVFQAFRDLWAPMWNKHEDTPFSRWEPLLGTLFEIVPKPGVPFPWQPITLAQWQESLKRRKSKSATGPDGISREDLLNMPVGYQQALVDIVNQIEQGTEPWPQTLLTGLISNIEKHQRACLPGHYRPITVLSQVYRTWGSIRSRQLLQWLSTFAPPQLIGNRPSSSTKDLWWNMAETIECKLQSGTAMSGLVTDLQKCFNQIPRPIVAGLARHLGIPLSLVGSWHDAAAKIQRRFVVGGACSDATLSCTGYPEGDGMSVVACAILNIGAHYFAEQASTSLNFHSYVDNWEVSTNQVSDVPLALARIRDLVQALDMKIDEGKTFVWSLRAQDRSWLKRQGLTVCHDAKDLGGHVVYCKKKTMHTIRNRIASNVEVWDWMSRSPAPPDQKLRLLSSVVWPRCFYGISALWIAPDHCKKLRAAAMQALHWKQQGASSLVQFALGPDLRSDPGFHCVLATFMDFRKHCTPEIAFEVVSGLVLGPNPRFSQGPCGAFLLRLHELGWAWMHHGYIQDHFGLTLHILDTPVQLLVRRLKLAWAAMIGGQMMRRPGFEGLHNVDLEVTHESRSLLSAQEQGMMRTVSNGTFITRDVQIHQGFHVSTDCPFCEQPDSMHHRIWECPHFADIRNQLPHDMQTMILAAPRCFHLRGWAMLPPAFTDFVRALELIPDTLNDHAGPGYSPTPLRLFLDGSCLERQCARLRIATWAVCYANLDTGDFPPLSQGGVCGGLQTILRGEVCAAISACMYSLKTSQQIYLWTDNQLVYTRVHAWLSGSHLPIGRNQKDHDLWQQLFALVWKARDARLLCGVVKVRSHQDDQRYSDVVEKWAIRGNEAADTAASSARDSLPTTVRQEWQRLAQQHASSRLITHRLHKMIVQTSARALDQNPSVRQQDEERWDRRLQQAPTEPTEPPSFVPLPLLDVLPPKHTLGAILDKLYPWLSSLLSSADAKPTWVPSAHMLIHYQGHTGDWGFKFNQKTNKWIDLASHVQECGFEFSPAANWIVAAVRCLARLLQAQYTVESRIPDSHLFKCWTPCILLPFSVSTFRKIDQLLVARGVTGIKSVRTAFKAVGSFRNVLRS